MRSLMHAAIGAVAALVLVLSCSDDSPTDVDAATNCEPPLAGRITTVEGTQSTALAVVSVGASCAAGALRLGGGCEIETQGSLTLQLYEAGDRNGSQNSYACVWNNPDAIQVTVKAWVTCLTPAS